MGGASAGLPPAVSTHDYAELARATLPRPVWDYLAGGAGDEVTVRANRAAFRRLALRPRVLTGVHSPQLHTTLLGSPASMPIGVAPMAYHCLAHADGEAGTVRAAGAEGVITVVSTFASQSLEEVAAAASGPLWFQLYCLRDRSATQGLLRRAAAAGYRAVVLTVDAGVMGYRDRDVRNRFALPSHISPANLPPAGTALDPTLSGLNGQLVDDRLVWEDLDRLGDQAHLPLILKGILTAEDASRAAAMGVAGIIVSNHGGRQLDGAVSTLDALPEVLRAAGDRCEVYLDGGVRRGTDVLKALALGARAVFVGRPLLWGLAVAGSAGVRDVLRMYRHELELAMALCGVPTVQEIGPHLVGSSSGTDVVFSVGSRTVRGGNT